MGTDWWADGAAGPTILVQVTPRDFRVRAIWFIVLGAALVIASVTLGGAGDNLAPLVWALAATAYGIHSAWRARRQETQTVLRIDRSGLVVGSEGIERSWADVVLVWVGSSTGLPIPVLGWPTLSVFSQRSIDFARRAGTPPAALYSLRVGGFHRRTSVLCDRLADITDAQVVNGRQVSRRTAASALLTREP